MFARIRVISAIVAGFAFSNSPAQTKPDQPPNGLQISGRIVDQFGTPLSGQVLNFRVVDTGSPEVVRTTEDGRFAFTGKGYIPYELYVPATGSNAFTLISWVVVADGRDFDFGDVRLQFPSAGSPMARIAGPLKVIASRTDGDITIASPRPSSPKSILSLYTVCSATKDWCDYKMLHIVSGDGRDALAPKEKDQVGFSSPRISDDGAEAGWLSDSDFCCTSYPISLALIVYRPGKPIRRFEGNRAIMGWHFVARGKQVAFYTDFLHGNSVPQHQLRDVETGRIVATWKGQITNNA